MLTVNTVVILLLVHFVADFILQRDKWAQNKASSLGSLSKHVLTYGIALFAASVLILGIPVDAAAGFALVNMAAHYLTDFWSSRKMKSYVEVTGRDSRGITVYWPYGARRKFFIVLGIDQFLHYAVLFLTFERLV